jgi:hypothetical protein
MAKTQTFGDKLKKQKAQELVNVKIVHTVRSDKGSLRFLAKFVKVKDVSELNNIDIKNL